MTPWTPRERALREALKIARPMMNRIDHNVGVYEKELEAEALVDALLADPPPPDLSAALVEAKKALWDYRSAQRRMLDKWAEGDDNVRRDLWQNLHKCESAADSAIARIDAALEVKP